MFNKNIVVAAATEISLDVVVNTDLSVPEKASTYTTIYKGCSLTIANQE